MKKIKDLEKIKNIYIDWKPSDIAFIKSLEWSNCNLVIIFYSQIREYVSGWPDISKKFFEISITFKSVSSLKINFNGSRLHQILGFDIIDISDNNLEKINFLVEDYEDNSIHFYCEEVEIMKVSDSENIVNSLYQKD